MMGSLDRAVELLDRKTQAVRPMQKVVRRQPQAFVRQERPAQARPERLDFSLGSRLDEDTLKALRAVASSNGQRNG